MKKKELHETKNFAVSKVDRNWDITQSKARCSCGKSFMSNISLMLHQDKEWKKLTLYVRNE